MNREEYLTKILKYNVPIFIEFIKNRGGVSEDEWKWLQTDEDSVDFPMGVAARADEFLLFPEDTETFEKAMFTLTLSLAIMSFVPCGIRFMGLHFDSKIDNFINIED